MPDVNSFKYLSFGKSKVRSVSSGPTSTSGVLSGNKQQSAVADGSLEAGYSSIDEFKGEESDHFGNNNFEESYNGSLNTLDTATSNSLNNSKSPAIGLPLPSPTRNLKSGARTLRGLGLGSGEKIPTSRRRRSISAGFRIVTSPIKLDTNKSSPSNYHSTASSPINQNSGTVSLSQYANAQHDKNNNNSANNASNNSFFQSRSNNNSLTFSPTNNTNNNTFKSATNFSTDIVDYELLKPVGPTDDNLCWLYTAKYRTTEEIISLKVISITEFLEDDILLNKLANKAINTGLLSHPAILRYYLSFIEDERIWTVMPPIRLGTCRRLLTTYFPNGFTDQLTATILHEIASALVYLGHSGWIHK